MKMDLLWLRTKQRKILISSPTIEEEEVEEVEAVEEEEITEEVEEEATEVVENEEEVKVEVIGAETTTTSSTGRGET